MVVVDVVGVVGVEEVGGMVVEVGVGGIGDVVVD